MVKSAIDDNCIIEAVHDVPFSQLHDELLGISERRGYCYALNRSAARIWELIQVPLRIGSICEVLCSEFEVEQDHCAIDVVDFVLAMKAAGLVEVKDVEVKKDAESA